MKKTIFFLSSFVLLVSIIVACNSETKEPTVATPSTEDSVKAVLDSGIYLVHSVVNCVDCHSMLDTSKFSAL